MKRKEINELHQKTKEELRKLLIEVQNKLVELQTAAADKTKDVRAKSKLKDKIARIKTILVEQGLAGGNQ